MSFCPKVGMGGWSSLAASHRYLCMCAPGNVQPLFVRLRLQTAATAAGRKYEGCDPGPGSGRGPRAGLESFYVCVCVCGVSRLRVLPMYVWPLAYLSPGDRVMISC